VLSGKKIDEFKRVLESRIADTEHAFTDAEQEIRALSARQADDLIKLLLNTIDRLFRSKRLPDGRA
jgi:hypothetical protein